MNNKPDTLQLMGEIEELRREVNYLRKLSEKSLSRLMQADFHSISMRHELEQKRRGFSLMADLAVTLDPGTDFENVFISVSRRINAALNMQRTAVLLPVKNDYFQTSVLQGYPKEDADRINSYLIRVDDELLDPTQPVLITGADPEERLADFRGMLDLRYLISVPVMFNGEVRAILVSGRQIEQPPFSPRLGDSDVETVQMVGSYLAAMLAGEKLEQEESQRQDLEEIMKAVFNASVDGYVIWDSGQITRVSPGALKLFGLQDPQDFMNDNESFGLTNSHLSEIFKRVMVEGRVREEQLLKKFGGQMVPCEINHLPLKLHDGTCLLSYVRDLSAQKKTEQDLLLAKNEAEIAAKAKSEFLANMSHEIRTPLNGILGFTHILQGTEVDEQQAEYLDKIVESFDGLQRVINDILDFSKIDADKLVIERTELDLAKVLRSVADNHQAAVDRKGLALKVMMPHADEVLVGDPVRLKQVLNNLVSNAIKFTDKGFVEIKAERFKSDKPLGPDRVVYRFSVEDSGIGITPEERNRLFLPFSQADSSTTRKYGGTGLGLVISKRLTELMGGEIGCESRPGHGSFFYFTVVFGLSKKREQASGPREKKAPPLELPEHIKGSRVLLVEDNEVNQMVARRLLEKAGLKVAVTDNGFKALERLDKEEFDLVFMDVQMPEMDGLEATRRLRADPRFAQLPILAMTAHALQEDRDISLEAGMNDHITKPINLSDLYTALIRWLPEKH